MLQSYPRIAVKKPWIGNICIFGHNWIPKIACVSFPPAYSKNILPPSISYKSTLGIAKENPFPLSDQTKHASQHPQPTQDRNSLTDEFQKNRGSWLIVQKLLNVRDGLKECWKFNRANWYPRPLEILRKNGTSDGWIFIWLPRRFELVEGVVLSVQIMESFSQPRKLSLWRVFKAKNRLVWSHREPLIA